MEFKPGDLVFIRIWPECFPKGVSQKLHHRRAGPFKILQRLGSNAYHIELPSTLHLSPVFNVEDVTASEGHIEEVVPEPALINLPIHVKPREEIEDILNDQLVSTRLSKNFG